MIQKGGFMYTTEELKKIPYFDMSSIESLDDVLDSLTKVISRKHTIAYIENLIANKVPFAMGMIDLDNFKLINDNYGHNTGDEVLAKLGELLKQYVSNKGIVGRFGGDEFLIIYLGENSYNKIYDFIKEMYGDDKVVRRTYCLSATEPFITGTVGIATYPNDAIQYGDLFKKMDKALYRGKLKGRNCYIVYVDEKHKDIDVTKAMKIPSYVVYNDIASALESNKPIDEKITQALKYASDALKINGASLIYGDKYINFGDANYELSSDFNATNLVDAYNLFSSNSLNIVKKASPLLYDYMVNNKILSILLTQFEYKGKPLKILFYENKIERIWMQDNMALLVYLSRIISNYLQ